MQTSSAREWRVCRSFDPAIDLRELLDESGGQVFRDVDGDRIRALASDTIQFLRERDPKHLAFMDGEEPAWFVLRPLSVRQLREHVGGAEENEERFLRAFECAIVKIENWRGPGGQESPQSIVVQRDNRTFGRAKDGELDRLMGEHGFTLADFWDVGASAYCRATVPLGLGAQLLVPRSSLVALALRTARSRPVAPSAPTSTASDEARAAPPPTPSTPES